MTFTPVAKPDREQDTLADHLLDVARRHPESHRSFVPAHQVHEDLSALRQPL